jgi:hypothetical protein
LKAAVKFWQVSVDALGNESALRYVLRLNAVSVFADSVTDHVWLAVSVDWLIPKV